jgi:membrane protein
MADWRSRLQQLQASVRAVLEDRVLPGEGAAAKLHRFTHFWVLVWRSFVRNRCPIRASALAYATLLALIPMLAVVVSITSTFLKQEGEERIDQFIVRLVASVIPPASLSTNAPAGGAEPGPSNLEQVAASDGAGTGLTNSTGTALSGELPGFAKDSQAVAARKAISRQIHQFIQNTRSGALGVTGSILLIFAAISMLSRVEGTFNDIWGVARGRTWFMRIVLYWGVLSLAPLLLVVALGLATGPHLESTKHFLASLPFVGNFIVIFGFQALPVLVLCLTFAAFYMLMPNTHVQWQAAMVGGLAGGLLFHLNNLVSVLYVSRVVSNSKIYGSLGLVPVFMIGLYFSWLILLFGAQVAYAFQNRVTYLEEKQVEQINQRGREFVALRLMTLAGQRYLQAEPPPTVVEMARRLGVPSRLIQQILQTLITARLVVETTGRDPGYFPARPMETITCHDVLLAMRATQGQELATRDEPARAEVYGEFQRIQEAERQAAASVNLLELATRAGPALAERAVKALE